MKKLAMIGCGGIGGYHLDHFVKFDDIELVGFCDLIPERAEGFVKKAGKGKAFTDFRQMYDQTKPDMVCIGIPPHCHGEIELESISRGIHMFVEKPMALNLDLALDLRDQIAKKNLITAVGFQCRYDNINDAAKDFVGKNEIVVAQSTRVGGVPEVDWWRVRSLSGGQLVEQTVHNVDIMLYLLGEVESVYSVPTRGFIKQSEWPGYDTDDASTSIFKFKSGITGTMMTGAYSLNGASWDSKLTLGTRSSRLDYYLLSHVSIYGLAEADLAEEIAGVVKGDGMQRRNEKETGIRINSVIDAGTLCDRTFVDAVISGDASKIRSPYGNAIKTLAAVLACNESMETGQVVKVRG
ncbi:MAG: Gfo/Idh/MocA family oxidoreductase [Oscillospiraceae bacterium]|nr:Gfo/Idh/MocA family oxidoreductase [Oscillospiraceae bacterium]